jgi:hypothetical protein
LINYFAFVTRGFLGADGTFGFAGPLLAGSLLAGTVSTTGVATIASIPIGIGSTTGAATSTLYGASTGVADPNPNNDLILFNIIMSPLEFIYIN